MINRYVYEKHYILLAPTHPFLWKLSCPIELKMLLRILTVLTEKWMSMIALDKRSKKLQCHHFSHEKWLKVNALEQSVFSFANNKNSPKNWGEPTIIWHLLVFHNKAINGPKSRMKSKWCWLGPSGPDQAGRLAKWTMYYNPLGVSWTPKLESIIIGVILCNCSISAIFGSDN